MIPSPAGSNPARVVHQDYLGIFIFPPFKCYIGLAVMYGAFRRSNLLADAGSIPVLPTIGGQIMARDTLTIIYDNGNNEDLSVLVVCANGELINEYFGDEADRMYLALVGETY